MNGCHLVKEPDVFSIPFSKLRRKLASFGFDSNECAIEIEKGIQGGELKERWFDMGGVWNDGVPASAYTLYPTQGLWEVEFCSFDPVAGRMRRERQKSSPDEVKEITSLFAGRENRLLDVDMGIKIKSRFADAERWNQAPQFCIERREHASLLVSAAEAKIVTDPIGLGAERHYPIRCSEGEFANAVLISHCHYDHWNIPSISAYLGPEQQSEVITPMFPRTSLLTPFNLQKMLSEVEIPNHAPPWWSTYNVGDLEVDILPFYGEQPSRNLPWFHSDVRNWGNCFRINTQDFSVLMLVDSGADPWGNMLDVVRRSVEQKGPIDLLCSTLRRLPTPFEGGLEPYWMVFPFKDLQQLYHQYNLGFLESSLNGVNGIAEICRVANIKYFAPYAHGFNGVGVPIKDVGWGLGECSEETLLKQLDAANQLAGSNVKILNWLPGERIIKSNSELMIDKITC